MDHRPPVYPPFDRLRDELFRRVPAGTAVPDPHPMAVSPWQAMSLLQKAVRRGEEALALRAAATLLRDAPERLWRRIGGIAFEDIGVADLPTLGLIATALHGKRLRQQLGDEWAVTAWAVATLCRARKSRSADDLFMALPTLPALADKRRDLAQMPNSRLRLVALTTRCLHERALVLVYMLGTDRPGSPLPAHRGEAALAFDLLDELGVAPTTLAICREGYRKTGEYLPPLVALLTLENGLRAGTSDDAMPPQTLIGDLPCWALDMFTREGKAALTRLLSTQAGIVGLAQALVPKARQTGFLGQVLFRVEGGLLRNRVGGDLHDRLHAQLRFETLGVPPLQAAEALALMREDLPLLNRLRAQVVGVRDHG